MRHDACGARARACTLGFVIAHSALESAQPFPPGTASVEMSAIPPTITPALLAEAHAELVALSNALSHRAAALQKRLDKVEAREAAVEAREAAVQDTEAHVEAREVAVARSEKDCAMLRTLLEKEAERLIQAARERLDAAADAHVQRLQTACGALKQQCEHLRMPSAKAREVPSKNRAVLRVPLKPTAAQGVGAPSEAPQSVEGGDVPSQCDVPSQLSSQRQHYQLSRARDLTSALLLELDAAVSDKDPAGKGPSSTAQPGSSILPAAAAALQAARRRALPGAADALLNDQGLGVSQCWRLLCMLKNGLDSDDTSAHASAAPALDHALPQWERRLRRHLARAAAQDAEPLFGRAVASSHPAAPLAALMLLRLSMRAQQGSHGGAGAAGGGVRDACEALSCLRRLASDPASRTALLRLGAVDELVPLIGSTRSSLARPAAAALLGLCAAPPALSAPGNTTAPLYRLATPAFFRAAIAALTSAGAAEGEDSLAACVSILLQRLSSRPAYRALFETSGLRRAVQVLLHELATADSSTDFVRFNLRSMLHNTEPDSTHGTPDTPVSHKTSAGFAVQYASPGVVVPSTPS